MSISSLHDPTSSSEEHILGHWYKLRIIISIGFLMVVFALLTVACQTLEIGFVKPPTPDRAAVSTLSALMLQGTQYAQMANEIASTPEPVYGSVSGSLCYPSERSPAMKIYFVNTSSSDQVELSVSEQASNYYKELLPGSYYIYSWAPDYLIGGLYSKAVPCGLSEKCSDHSPQPVEVQAGQQLNDINLCDWGFSAEQLPIPSGFLLPGEDNKLRLLRGLYFQTSDGLYQVNLGGKITQALTNQVTDISPDGKKAVFVDNNDLWIASLEAGSTEPPVNITLSKDRIEKNARWWPGHPGVIVFLSKTPQDSTTNLGYLSVVSEDGSGYQVLDPEQASTGDFALSPDKKTIAYDRAGEAYLYHWDTGPERFDVKGLSFRAASNPSYSPDGKRLAWMVGGNIGPGSDWMMAVAVYDLDKNASHLLHPYTPLPSGDYSPAAVWSPDSQWMAFVAMAEGPQGGIWLLRPDSPQEDYHLGGSDPLWSPDGKWLLYNRLEANTIQSWIAEAGNWQIQPAGLPSNANFVKWLK